MNSSTQETLLGAADHFYKKYSHFDIGLAIRNFSDGKPPVAKEVTSLIAMTVNLIRSIDESAIRRVAGTDDGLCEAAELMLKQYFMVTEKRRVEPWRELCEAWQGGLQRRRNAVKKYWAFAGLTENQSPVSAELPGAFLEDIVNLQREQFAIRFEIARPTRLIG